LRAYQQWLFHINWHGIIHMDMGTMIAEHNLILMSKEDREWCMVFDFKNITMCHEWLLNHANVHLKWIFCVEFAILFYFTNLTCVHYYCVLHFFQNWWCRKLGHITDEEQKLIAIRRLVHGATFSACLTIMAILLL
jgi:hypothetical protein